VPNPPISQNGLVHNLAHFFSHKDEDRRKWHCSCLHL